ncbi:MAG: hypothetical protein RIB60_11370 [Phycisphaerales bacterium]
MKKAIATVGAVLLAAGAANGAITQYSQDFEGLAAGSPTALGDDGWLVGANVFDAGGGFIYNYFAFPAPNGSGAFSNVASGEGGPAQGAQQLVAFNDYNNTDHSNFPDRIIEANLFQEMMIDASNVGQTWTFTFDYKTGDLQAPSTAAAFIKTIDPGNGFATTNFVQTATDDSSLWNTKSLSLTIDNGLVGQLFQFGFLNTASNFNPSGVFYDNINVTPTPATAALLGLGGLAATRRRR